jgi:peptidoglycan/xylan/chitin deacetylase (PgdA/CDA1 family)
VKKYLTLLFAVPFVLSASAQTKVYIAPFRYDATGAYTLIHDDFGADYARGIEEYIDTMNFNRKLPICFAAITGQCDKQDWKKANELIAHGHQILNHTMSHKCGQPQSWCTFGDWNEKDFPVEIDQSTDLILKNTGKHPAFFVFPFDLFTDTMIAYLRAKHYVGARAGKQGTLNNPDLNDPFMLNYTVFRPGEPLSKLNEMANKAIQTKSWAIRVMHGIEDESWAHITAAEYATHLDYLQKEVQQHHLWMATLSDIVTYQYNKQLIEIKIAEQNQKGQVTKILLEMQKTPLPDGNLMTHDTLTVVIQQALEIPKSISQAQQYIPFEVRDGKIIFDVNLPVKEIVLAY